jgi:hypothetical protein
MRCLVCGNGIGPLRRWVDRKYCCDAHRKRARRLSARAVRDALDFNELEEPWLVMPDLHGRQRPLGSGLGPASAILLAAVAIFLVLALPSDQRPTGRVNYRPSVFASLSQKLRELVPGGPSFDLREDFQSGSRDWVTGQGVAGGEARGSDQARLARLRLWKPTLGMADYQMMFQGQIESKAIGWAFRASDLQNYYATKITITKPGIQRAEIVRYVVTDGRQSDHVQLPLPMLLEEHTPYQVRVKVNKDRFSTLINGQLVDTWNDGRHASGGIGFFSDPGERALVSWVRVTDRESLIERLLSFSLLMGPSDPFFAGAWRP